MGAHFDPDVVDAFDAIAPLFDGIDTHRIHGDCHRGNIIDRPGTGLALIDFDDMVRGPCVQDLWLVVPGNDPSARGKPPPADEPRTVIFTSRQGNAAGARTGGWPVGAGR